MAAPKSAQLNQPASLGTPCLSSSRAQLDAAQITDWGGSGGARGQQTLWIDGSFWTATSENQDEVSEKRCLLPWPIRACDGCYAMNYWASHLVQLALCGLMCGTSTSDHFQCQRGLRRELRMSLCGSGCSCRQANIRAGTGDLHFLQLQ